MRNQPRVRTLASVRNVVPAFAESRRSMARSEMKEKMSSAFVSFKSTLYYTKIKRTSNPSPKHEQGNDELNKHSNNDRVPFDRLTIPRRPPKSHKEHGQAEQAHGAIRSSIILAFGAGERADDDDGNRQSGPQRNPHTFRDHGSKAHTGIVPYPVHGFHEQCDWDVKGQKSDHDCQPNQEWYDPSQIVAVKNKACNPPSTKVPASAIE